VGSDISIDVMWNKGTRILTALALNSACINIGNVYFGSYDLPVTYVCLLWLLELIQTGKIITQSAVCALKEKWNIRGSGDWNSVTHVQHTVPCLTLLLA